MPPTPDELSELGQRSLFAAGVSARFGRRQRLFESRLLDVRLPAGSQVRARVDPAGCNLLVTPGLEAIGAGPLPDLRFERLFYRFETSKFEVSLAGLSGAILDPFIEHYLNAKVRPRLPKAIRKNGYSVQTDPDLGRTVRELAGVLTLASGAGGGGSTSSASNSLADATGLTIFLQIKMADDLVVPVEGLDGLEIALRKNAIVSVWLRTNGAATAPTLDHLELEAPGSGLVIRSTGSGLLSALTALEVTRLTVYPGPNFTFEYELLLEKALAAPQLLGRFAELLGGRYAPGAAPEVRLRSLRPMIDEMLAEGLGGLFSGLLAEYDEIVPGISLVELVRG